MITNKNLIALGIVKLNDTVKPSSPFIKRFKWVYGCIEPVCIHLKGRVQRKPKINSNFYTQFLFLKSLKKYAVQSF